MRGAWAGPRGSAICLVAAAGRSSSAERLRPDGPSRAHHVTLRRRTPKSTGTPRKLRHGVHRRALLRGQGPRPRDASVVRSLRSWASRWTSPPRGSSWRGRAALPRGGDVAGDALGRIARRAGVAAHGRAWPNGSSLRPWRRGPRLLGLGTLALPFSTLFFAHALGGARLRVRAPTARPALGEQRRRRRRSRRPRRPRRRVPLAIVASRSAARRTRTPAPLARARSPVSALAVFNAWAFGCPFELSYKNAVIVPGESGHDVIGANDRGFLRASLRASGSGAELLASDKGLPVLTPLVAAGVAGLVTLLRGPARREAMLVLGLSGAFSHARTSCRSRRRAGPRS